MKHRKLMLIAAICVAVAMCACAGRKHQKQAASNAMAGVDAIATTPDEKVIGEGIKTNIETAVGEMRDRLPESARTPAQITEDPKGYVAEAEATQQAWIKSKSLWGWVSAGVLTVLGILRFVPGAHQPIVSLVRGVLESRADKETREREEGLARAARTMMGAIESEDAGKIKDIVAKKLPPSAKEAVDAYLAEMTHG
jgi:glucose/arabinose dehydrogenase